MRRHVIIGRFGPDDKTRVPKARDEVASTLQLVAGKRLDHGIGHALADLKALYLTPSEIGADILVVAAHVHAADTRISRSTESQDAWTREIRLVIPVSDPARWTSLDAERRLGRRARLGTSARHIASKYRSHGHPESKRLTCGARIGARMVNLMFRWVPLRAGVSPKGVHNGGEAGPD
jgi:hypothetical protein